MKIINLADKVTVRAKGVIMIVSLLIITGAFMISLSIASLVMVAISISRTQGDSVRAYFAADSGLEKALAFDKQESIDQRNCSPGDPDEDLCCDTEGECLFFEKTPFDREDSPSGCRPCAEINNEPQYMNDDDLTQSYQLIYGGVSEDGSQLKLESTGNSNGIKRSIKLTINRTAGCIPVCSSSSTPEYQCGYNGCNGFCGQCDPGEHCSDFLCVEN